MSISLKFVPDGQIDNKFNIGRGIGFVPNLNLNWISLYDNNKHKYYLSRTFISKFHLPKVTHFVQASVCEMCA